MLRFCATLAAIVLQVAAARAEANPQLLRDFKRVVIADDALLVQKAAARELAGYAGRIAGTKIEVVPLSKFDAKAEGLSFFVGDGAAARALGKEPGPWKQEEYLLKSVRSGMVLAGHDGPGTVWSIHTPGGSMLAVYTLLDDHLGVRWFWPGPYGEHVPKKTDAVVPHLDVRAKPAFEIRSVSTGYFAYHTPEFGESARQWARRSRQGWVKSAVFGHSWEFAFDQRDGKTFKEHPEWFALVKGVRRPPQMCTTEPAVLDRMVEHVLKAKIDIVNISPSDGGGFCECERCRALDVPGVLAYDGKTVQLSDRMFTYANEVARRVREKDPDKAVGMFAYTFYNRPPLKIKQLEPNIYLSFVYQSAAHRDPENLKEWHETLAGWKKLGAKLVVREGWNNHYYLDLPFLHTRQIIDNLAEAKELGFIGAYGDGSKNFAAVAPNFWAITRMTWDPRRDKAAVMNDFYESAYGPVAGEMRAYFESYEKALDENWAKRDCNVDTTGIAYANVIGAWNKLIPPEAVEAAERHLKEAEKKAPEGEYAERVRFHRFGHEHTKLMLELLAGYRRLAELGLKIDVFRAVAKNREDQPAEKERLLKRMYELGERRERMLLEHRDWAGPDEGLYAFANDQKIRQWHAEVKEALGIDKPTALTKKSLQNP